MPPSDSTSRAGQRGARLVRHDAAEEALDVAVLALGWRGGAGERVDVRQGAAGRIAQGQHR